MIASLIQANCRISTAFEVVKLESMPHQSHTVTGRSQDLKNLINLLEATRLRPLFSQRHESDGMAKMSMRSYPQPGINSGSHSRLKENLVPSKINKRMRKQWYFRPFRRLKIWVILNFKGLAQYKVYTLFAFSLCTLTKNEMSVPFVPLPSRAPNRRLKRKQYLWYTVQIFLQYHFTASRD